MFRSLVFEPLSWELLCEAFGLDRTPQTPPTPACSSNRPSRFRFLGWRVIRIGHRMATVAGENAISAEEGGCVLVSAGLRFWRYGAEL